MRASIAGAILLGLLPSALSVNAQPAPAAFPLAGDWNGAWLNQGTLNHLVLHMNTTPEGKMTALLDYVEQDITGVPAIGGSFDGTHLVLRFFYWKPSSNGTGDLQYQVASYEATVNAANSEITGVWKQEDTRPLNFTRVTWQAKVPKPAPPTIFDGDWAGIEYEAKGIQLHFVFHIHNTDEGLLVLLDCPEEKFKGARGSKISYDESARQISISIGMAIFAGKMSADGKALDTSMTEPGYHFLIHFDRINPKQH